MINEGDSRLHHGMSSDGIKQRARHDMVAIETVRMGARSVAARVVVVPCRRVVEELEAEGLWRAYNSISEAIKKLTSGVGVKTFDPNRVTGGSGDTEDEYGIVVRYVNWVDLCKAKYKSPLMVRSMIVDGLTFEKLDKAYKFRNGTAKKNLFECLQLWSEV